MRYTYGGMIEHLGSERREHAMYAGFEQVLLLLKYAWDLKLEGLEAAEARLYLQWTLWCLSPQKFDGFLTQIITQHFINIRG